MDILSKRIISYFQPIIAVDTNEIYSFEVLGRYVDDDGAVKSLGAFFSDETVSSADAGKDQYLFINLRLEWIANYAEEEF